MTLYLPRNLGALAAITDKEPSRFATGGVRVIDCEDGSYRVEATDGRRLAIVRGPCALPICCEDLEGIETPLKQTVVGKDDWENAFKQLGKGKGNDRIGFVSWQEQSRIANPDEGSDGNQFLFSNGSQTIKGQPQEGRFPNVDSALPTKAPLITIRLDPILLASLMELARALGIGAIDLLYYGQGKPLGIIGQNATGQFFDGLIMPLDQPPKPTIKKENKDEQNASANVHAQSKV